MSDNIEESVISKFQSLFALRIDESAEISNHAQLIAFIRVIDEDAIIINQFLCCKQLPTSTEGQDIFDTIIICLEKYGISWDSCVGIFSNGAPSMVGCIKGFASLVEKQILYIVRTRCFLH